MEECSPDSQGSRAAELCTQTGNAFGQHVTVGRCRFEADTTDVTVSRLAEMNAGKKDCYIAAEFYNALC
jgi:hypothetical protein